MFDLGRFKGGESAVTPSGVWRRVTEGEFEFVSWQGERLATRSVPDGWAPIGEAATGLVVVNRWTRSEADYRAGEEEAVALAADGRRATLPGVGEVCAVADRYVIRIRRRAELSIVDVLAGTVVEVEQPDVVERWWTLDVCLDQPTGTSRSRATRLGRPTRPRASGCRQSSPSSTSSPASLRSATASTVPSTPSGRRTAPISSSATSTTIACTSWTLRR